MLPPYRARQIEQVCWLVLLLCLGYIGFAYQQAYAAGLRAGALARSASPVNASPSSGAVIGELRIPAIGLSVPVIEDDDTGSLLRGVGHIRGTAFPGGLGTVGLAGHRDTFLRPLAKIAPHMEHVEIDVSRGAALYHYVVDTTEIVHPEAVNVLNQQNSPELVLVTCYPFHYIGAAPLRFIVHAHLVSLTPDDAAR